MARKKLGERLESLGLLCDTHKAQREDGNEVFLQVKIPPQLMLQVAERMELQKERTVSLEAYTEGAETVTVPFELRLSKCYKGVDDPASFFLSSERQVTSRG